MYTMEELVPIVGRLAEKYCAGESSSVTYEKAEQLMGAVLYCIREAENAGAYMPGSAVQYAGEDVTYVSDSLELSDNPVTDRVKTVKTVAAHQKAVVVSKEMSAKQAYERGVKLVKQKTEYGLALYNRLMTNFAWYGSMCLHDTMVKGIPEFFKWYDCLLEPQNTILTLDYPVLRDLSGLAGIDRIYGFLECIRLEQKFLGKLPHEYVRAALSEYNSGYAEMIENICEIVLRSVLMHMLARRPLSQQKLERDDCLRIQALCGANDTAGIRLLLEESVKGLTAQYFEGDEILSDYLCCAVEDMAVRLKNTAPYRER